VHLNNCTEPGEEAALTDCATQRSIRFTGTHSPSDNAHTFKVIKHMGKPYLVTSLHFLQGSTAFMK